MDSVERQLLETQTQFAEFRLASKQLEEELENEIEILETKNLNLTNKYQSTLQELKSLQEQSHTSHFEYDSVLDSLRNEIDQLKKERDDRVHKTIELESELDLLQAQQRILTSSLGDYEIKFNQLLELKADLDTSFESSKVYTKNIQNILNQMRHLSFHQNHSKEEDSSSSSSTFLNFVNEMETNLQYLENHFNSCQSMLQTSDQSTSN